MALYFMLFVLIDDSLMNEDIEANCDGEYDFNEAFQNESDDANDEDDEYFAEAVDKDRSIQFDDQFDQYSSDD